MLGVEGESTVTKVPRLLEGAKLAFVLALREAFSSEFTDEELRYSQDKDATKLKIFTAHPLTLEFYPSLVVSSSGGDASIKYLQDDFVEDIGDNKSLFAGQLSFSISITILSNSTLERERIMDHLIIFVRHLFRGTIHGFNLEYTRDIRIGPENIVEVENRPVYEQTMDIPCYMEYKAVVDLRKLETIRAIDVSDVSVNIKNFED
jgi:hypothetical protein